MKHVRFTAVAAVLALACFNACAQSQSPSLAERIKVGAPKGITKAFFACVDEADKKLDSLALALCETDEKEIQKNRMDSLYKLTLSKVNAQDRETLTIIQKSWLEFYRETGKMDDVFFNADGGDGNFDVALREIYRICERANDLGLYLRLAKSE